MRKIVTDLNREPPMSSVKFILDKDKCIGADACGGVCARICPPDIIEYSDDRTGKRFPLSLISRCA